VFLGASNLSRSFPTVVSLVRSTFPEPVSICAAKGRGRSYGLEAGCLGKKFPGIFFSNIWHALEEDQALPISAWVTDIGNDLGYEVPVETILEWVWGCVDRLKSRGAQVVVSDLPLESLRRVSERKFRWFRTLLFPRCRLSREELLRRAEILSRELWREGKARKTPIFSLQNQWYGYDPLHPKRRSFHVMWQELFRAAGHDPRTIKRDRATLLMSRYLRSLKPQSWSQFSVRRGAFQPSGRLQDGTTIALY